MGKRVPTLEELPDTLTAQHIADHLQVSRRRVYEHFQMSPEVGGIPNYEFGISKRVDKSDFIEWKAAQKQKHLQQLAK